MKKSVLIYNARLLDESTDSPGAVLIVDSKIRSVFEGYFTSCETVEKMAKAVMKEDGIDEIFPLELYNAKNLTLTPAFIDMHVHLRYPGQTEKEDLNSGLSAAASGGFGTVVAMPNTNPVVSSFEAAIKIEQEAASLGLTHLFQTVSITKNFDGKDCSHLDFIDNRFIPVITEDGHDVSDAAVMLNAMQKAAEKNVIVSCHCEDVNFAQQARPLRQQALAIMKEIGLSAWGADDIEDIEDEYSEQINQIDLLLTKANEFLDLAENLATVRNIMLAKRAKCHIHIAHVSTAAAIDIIREMKEIADDNDFFYTEGGGSYEAYKNKNTFTYMPKKRIESAFKITCEVTPHHLALCGTDEPYIRALVNPPLREQFDRNSLFEALYDGTVDVISTDHAPHTSEDKANGSPGFTGLETAFGVCNTVIVKELQFSPKKLSQLMSANPARILGLQKGVLKPGYDADLTLLDPDEQWIVNSDLFYSKGKATPFEGRKLTGRVKSLFIDGKLVFER